MAFQQARPYDTLLIDGGQLYGGIQKLQAGERQGQLQQLQLEMERQKMQRAQQAYQAQQTLLGQIQDPRERLAATVAPDKFAASVFRDPKDRYHATDSGVWDYGQGNGPPAFIPRPNAGAYRTLDGRVVGGAGGAPGGGGGTVRSPGANLAGAAPAGATDFRTARRRFETGGHPDPANAANPNSSARGPDQFIESTWERLLTTKGRAFIDMKLGPGADLNDPRVKQAIQDLRNDEDVSNAMAEEYAAENARELQAAGIEPSTRNLVVAHFLGGSGAKRFLAADPSAPAASHADPAQVKANRSVFFDGTGRPRTVAEVLAEVDRRTGAQQPGGPVQQTGGQTQQTQRTADGSHLQPLLDDKGKFDNDFGYNPATGQVERYPSRAASTTVNIGDKTGTKEMVEGRWKIYNQARDRALNAVQMAPKLDMLEQLIESIPVQGAGANLLYQVVGTASTIAQAAGIPQGTIDAATKAVTDIDSGDQARAAQAQKIINDFVTQTLRSAFQGMGSSSDREMRGIERAQASLENPREANLGLIRNVLRPSIDRERALWEQLLPLQDDNPELAGLDRIMWDFGQRWNQRKAPETPAPKEGADSQEGGRTPQPASGPPSYSQERLQQIMGLYPEARQAPDGFYYIPDPERPGKYLQLLPQ